MNEIKAKFKILLIILLHFVMTEKIMHADVTTPISQPLTADSSASFQGLLNNISSYPALTINDKNQVIQIPVNRISRYVLPVDVMTMAQLSNLSVLRPTDNNAYKNYPSGSALFPKNSNVAQQFDGVVSSIKSNQELIKFFRKIHFNCLNQMYAYLMKIYTNLIARHTGSSRDKTGNLVIDTAAFLGDEKTYATNQKILIMSHLVSLIELQFHGMVLACSPQTPYIFATPAGKIYIQNDFSIDLSTFASTQTDEVMQQVQKNYTDFLKKYITFFQTYTSLLSTQDTTTGFTQFYTAVKAMQSSPSFANMNPPMFFYDDESVRAIKMIPYLASQLPTKSALIDWADDAVNAVTKNIMQNNRPVAYFKDAANNSTQNKSQAAHLCILSQSGDNMFEEELLKQPDWLNTSQGVIAMLQACLGDFSKIINLNILDPYTQAILEKTLNGSVSSQTSQTVSDLSAAMVPPAPTAADKAAADKAAADKAAADKAAADKAAADKAAADKAAADKAAADKAAADKAAADKAAADKAAADKAAADKAAADKAAADKAAADKAAADKAAADKVNQDAAIKSAQDAAAKQAQDMAAKQAAARAASQKK
ncbi:hypothetical protein [Candidatus Chromulinivorax destructor]|uniref:hypothetical protein n=1 Tax=Candidatus Chromulinivorax destructor TaxID=2066483 RepID=UPI002076948C|nr:hypothetical protein [Candidatus Chromulinivorax destructor]